MTSLIKQLTCVITLLLSVHLEIYSETFKQQPGTSTRRSPTGSWHCCQARSSGVVAGRKANDSAALPLSRRGKQVRERTATSSLVKPLGTFLRVPGGTIREGMLQEDVTKLPLKYKTMHAVDGFGQPTLEVTYEYLRRNPGKVVIIRYRYDEHGDLRVISVREQSTIGSERDSEVTVPLSDSGSSNNAPISWFLSDALAFASARA